MDVRGKDSLQSLCFFARIKYDNMDEEEKSTEKILQREPTVGEREARFGVLEHGLGVLHLNSEDARMPPLKGKEYLKGILEEAKLCERLCEVEW